MICRVCDNNELIPTVDLGMHPLGHHFLSKDQIGKEHLYPLRLVVCSNCSTAQLDHTVKKEVMYSDHTYLSGITKSLENHFRETARLVDEQFNKDKQNKSVLDIGSNDGTQLKAYQDLGYEVLGVEAAKTIAEIANNNNVPTLHEFFNLETAKKIDRKFDVINASGVFFHLEELHSVTEGIKFSLKSDGVFVVQFMYMKNIMQNTAFDQIYHEHLLYYTLKTIETLLNRHGLEMFDAYFSPIHGGSIIGYISHPGAHPKTDRLLELRKEEEEAKTNELSTYFKFAEDIKKLKEVNLEYLLQKKQEGKKIYGMGAPVKGNTLLNYFGIGTDILDCLVEKNELRKDLYSPGMNIPVHMEKEVSPPDLYYVLAWNFKKEILNNNQNLIANGTEFYFPIDPKN